MWIDAFCIVQDDLEDMSAQINNMAGIYASAKVCVIAAAGDGLPSVASMRLSCAVKAFYIDEDLLLGLAAPSLSEILQTTRWRSRGWTY